MLLLINNVLLLVAMLTVLFGTLFPLFMDALKLGKYSVGPPYFNAVFIPLMAILLVFMGFGPTAHWKRTGFSSLVAKLAIAAVASVISGIIFSLWYGETFNVWAALAVCFAAWLVFSMLADVRDKLRHSASLTTGLQRLGRSYYGMLLGHLGMAFTVLGVCLTSQFSIEKDLRMVPGDSAELAGYRFEFIGTAYVTGPNYVGDQGRIEVTRDGHHIASLAPEKRRYNAQRGQVMTEADIDAGLFRDVYVAMGEHLGDGAWAVRLHYKPFVRWMWLGGLLMAGGALLAASDKRYRLRQRKHNTAGVKPAVVRPE
jgi:cytochrome c-type biogenesis protein CcmF